MLSGGNQLLKNPKGEQINLLSTSKTKGTVGGANKRTVEHQNKEWNVIIDVHSHTNNPYGPKSSGKNGDQGYKRDVRLKSPNAKFNIYYQRKYYPLLKN